jgi:hypothetical protein
MDFPEQITKLVSKLTELSKEEKVAWQEAGTKNTYLAQIGKAFVTVALSSSEPYGWYSLQVADDTGRIVDSASAPYAGRGAMDSSLQNWEALRNLYELARRRALQSEKVVSDLLSTLEAIR